MKTEIYLNGNLFPYSYDFIEYENEDNEKN